MEEIASSKDNSWVEGQSGLADTAGDDRNGNHARPAREEATGRTTPIAWESKKENVGYYPAERVFATVLGESASAVRWAGRFTYGGLNWISRTSHEFTIVGRVDRWMFYVQSAKAAKL